MVFGGGECKPGEEGVERWGASSPSLVASPVPFGSDFSGSEPADFSGAEPAGFSGSEPTDRKLVAMSRNARNSSATSRCASGELLPTLSRWDAQSVSRCCQVPEG